jgi:sec-independent protein translocase protein TatA
MGALSPIHLAIVVVVALLVFGPRKLPELAKGLGEAMKEFKKSVHAAAEEPEGPVVASISAPESAAPAVTAAAPTAPAAASPTPTGPAVGAPPQT